MARYTKAHKEAQKRYWKTTKSINVRFNSSELDLYDFAKEKDNTNGYIKELIRKDKESSS